MDIRPVSSEQDIADVAALADEIWSEYWPSIIGDAQTQYMIREFQSPTAIAEQIENGYLYYLSGSAETRLGYFALIPEGDRMMISKLYVRADARGKGLGRQMMQSIKDLAQEYNCSKLWLVVNRNNALAISVYEAMGFVRQGTRLKEIGNGFVMDDYVYEMSV